MRLTHSLLFTAAIVLASGAMPLQSHAQDACSLLPETPADTERGEFCVGNYWPRVGKKHFGGLSEYGATVSVKSAASAAEARRLLASIRSSGWRPVAYGDGGFEIREDPQKNDPPVPTVEEVRDNALSRDLSEILDDQGTYGARFTCGAQIFFVWGNPSKGAATRQLVAQLDARLRSMNMCGTSATTVAAPLIRPPTVGTNPPPVAEPTGTTGSTRYFDGKTAREIQAAQASGSRYLVVLQRYEDKEQGCMVEERAWVSDTRGSDGGRMAVRVGPSVTVCVGGSVVSAEQVNKSERDLQQARENLAKVLKRKDELEAYAKNPATSAQATAQLQKLQEWINYYDRIIAAIPRGLAASVPGT